MKTITFYRILLVVVMSLLLPQFSFCQGLSTRNLTRGADTGEIYLSCQWYSDCHNTINGIFRSIDNGESLSVQRKTIWAIGAGPIFGDSVSGALFLIPYNSIDTFGISFDYGKTFEKKYYHNIYEGASGCMAGELYVQGFGLYHGTGYVQYFTLQITNDSLRLQDVGALSLIHI